MKDRHEHAREIARRHFLDLGEFPAVALAIVFQGQVDGAEIILTLQDIVAGAQIVQTGKQQR